MYYTLKSAHAFPIRLVFKKGIFLEFEGFLAGLRAGYLDNSGGLGVWRDGELGGCEQSPGFTVANKQELLTAWRGLLADLFTPLSSLRSPQCSVRHSAVRSSF